MAEGVAKQPIVVKKIKKVAGGAHGGAWKIAYADFVTAMMAFFLLMWLLGSTSDATKEGIAEYFSTPLEVAMSGSDSGDRTSIIPGGGQDLMREEGQVKKEQKQTLLDQMTSEEAVEAERAREELFQLEQLKDKIESAIEANPSVAKFKDQLVLDITKDGLRIQIMDAQNRPMFSSGRAELQSYTKNILHEIGGMLNGVNNKISLSGHTDATPFPPGRSGYSNWELSADRANASRRELLIGNMAPDKVLKVVGLSSAALFDKTNPYNPINRRITITVLNREAEQEITESGGHSEIERLGQFSGEGIRNSGF